MAGKRGRGVEFGRDGVFARSFYIVGFSIVAFSIVAFCIVAFLAVAVRYSVHCLIQSSCAK